MNMPSSWEKQQERLNAVRRQVDSGGEPPDDDDMLKRVEKLEATIIQAQTDLAVIKSNYATKADIASTKTDIANSRNAIIMWVVSAIFLAQLLPAFMKWLGA